MNSTTLVTLYFIATLLLFGFGLMVSFAIIRIPAEIKKLRTELQKIKEEFQRL